MAAKHPLFRAGSAVSSSLKTRLWDRLRHVVDGLRELLEGHPLALAPDGLIDHAAAGVRDPRVECVRGRSASETGIAPRQTVNVPAPARR